MGQENRENFSGLIADIFSYFGSNKKPSSAQIAMWMQAAPHIPDHVAKEVKSYIFSNHQRLPSNIPMALKEAIQAQPSSDRPIQYDRTEDLRFPISLMWEAFWVLERGGEVEFRSFCDSVKMPLNDRARVHTKHLVCSKHNAKAAGGQTWITKS